MIPDYDFTVGNTITVAVAIYRNNLKQFLKLSVAAHLWLLIPVYGWGRYFAIAVSFIASLCLYFSIYTFYTLISYIFNQLYFYQWNFLYYGVWIIYLFLLVWANVLLLPFWQSVKAVVFEQLTNLDRKYSLR